MSSTPTLISMMIFGLMSLAAMLQNGFVIAVLGREWAQSRALPALDMIMISLASSRFFLHGLSLLNNFLASFGFCFQANFIGILWDFINTLILWLTASLAIFYCVKISSFSHPVFFWLKWRISQLVPRLLVGSLIMGGFSIIISAIGNTLASQMTTSDNCTLSHNTLAFFQYYYLCHVVLLWIPPFFLFLLSVILLTASLYRHVGQMRHHRPGPCDPSTQAHTMALKSLAFFLIFYTLFFLFLIFFITSRISIQSHWYWVREGTTYAVLFLHSIILVLSNPKLRKGLNDLCVVRSQD